MPSLYNGALLPWILPQFLDENGAPVSLGKLWSYTAGTSDLQDTFTQSDLDPSAKNTNPILLNAGGYPPQAIYLSAIGYKFTLLDANDVQIGEQDNVQDLGQIFAGTWGTLLGTGVTYGDGDVILPTTRLALIDSAAGATTVYLSPASDCTQPLTIKNMGGNAVTVTRDGTDFIDQTLTTKVIPAAASPSFPTLQLASNHISNWWVLG